jgi:HEAT repeat protein
MREHIDALALRLAEASDSQTRVDLIKRLMFTADPRAAAPLRAVVDDDNNVKFWLEEAFAYYLR